MTEKPKSKARPIMNFLLVFAIIFCFLTPVFEANGSHFGWGFAVLMFVGLPLMLSTPIFIGIQIYHFSKKKPNIAEILILVLAFIMWVITVIRFT